MLYIHKLADLNQHVSDIESISFIRDIRKSMRIPLTTETFGSQFSNYFVSQTDIEHINAAIEALQPIIDAIQAIQARKDMIHAHLNLHRIVQILQQLSLPLSSNMQFGQEIFAWQDTFTPQTVQTLNTIPLISTANQIAAVNTALSSIFAKILRNEGLGFQYADVINEAHTSSMAHLCESMENGYFFHTTLEEERSKASFERIKHRIAADALQEANLILQLLRVVKEGVDRAYELNMRMVGWAVLLFSYIKWANSRPEMA